MPQEIFYRDIHDEDAFDDVSKKYIFKKFNIDKVLPFFLKFFEKISANSVKSALWSRET